MSEQPKRILVIYHSADFDGIFSREIARLHFGENADYLGWNYGDAVPLVAAEVEQLYMIDISVKGLMDHPKLIWIDHHKTAMEEFPATIPGYRIDGVAACRLAWQWFAGLDTDDIEAIQKSAVIAMAETDCSPDGWHLPWKSDYVNRGVTEPLAVRLAGEYDIWDKRDPRADLFQHALRLPRVEIPALLADHEDDEPGSAEMMITALLARAEDVAYVQRERDEHHIKKSGFDLQWEGLTFLACNASGYNSHLFRAGTKPHHDALLGFRWDGKKWLVSLYGAPHRPDVDLSAIAKRHGGGGHRQACGFECAVLPFGLGASVPRGSRHRTAHELARELLALPDLRVYHLDPSFTDACDEEDETLGRPTCEVVKPREALSAEEVESAEADGFLLSNFITIVGDQPEDKDRQDLSWAARMVVNERDRQRAVEGYGDDHDDKHAGAELAEASMCYIQSEIGAVRSARGILPPGPPMRWPWKAEDWKPSADPRRTLIKAGALLLAEIERLDRLGTPKKGEA